MRGVVAVSGLQGQKVVRQRVGEEVGGRVGREGGSLTEVKALDCSSPDKLSKATDQPLRGRRVEKGSVAETVAWVKKVSMAWGRSGLGCSVAR